MTSTSKLDLKSDAISVECIEVAIAEDKKTSWDRALEGLTSEERASIGTLERLEALEQIKDAAVKQRALCIAKRERWRIGNVIICDVLDKIVTWIDKFTEIGDQFVTYDPAHMALPWACIRIVLRITVNGTRTFGSVLHGIEHISNLIGECVLIECIYLDNKSLKSYQGLVKLLDDLYAGVLRYLAKAMWYFNRGFAGILVGEAVFTSRLKDITDKEMEIDRFAQFVFVEKYQADHRKLFDTLREPMNSIQAIKNYLEDAEQWKVLDWISAIRFNQHHSSVSDDRLPESGEWLLQKKPYRKWKEGSSCSILWLNGIPGSGKSKLVSLVVDDLRLRPHTSTGTLAFFYCVRIASESARGNANEILRCLLRQLLCLGPSLPIMDSVMTMYNDLRKQGLRKLTFDETKKLIIDLTEFSAITIVIDALEECDSTTRWKLLDALEDIIASSFKLVKIFLSSRSHEDIASSLRKWTELSIVEADNAEDIKRFIDRQVKQAISSGRLLHGENVSDELRQHVIMTLNKGARGMFQWVSIQLQNLCSDKIKLPDDVMYHLPRLPKELEDIYLKIYEQISNLSPASHSMAKRVLQWLLCSRRPLVVNEFLAAVSLDSNGNFVNVSAREILDICCSLVVLDRTLNIFRFAHLSVQEYLKSRPEYSLAASHTLAAERCLRFFKRPDNHESSTVVSDDAFKSYATLFWAEHCYMSEGSWQNGTLGQVFRGFMIKDIIVDLSFEQWVAAAFSHLGPVSWDDPLHEESLNDKFESMLSDPANPIFASCVWGFDKAIQYYGASKKEDLQSFNIRGYASLHVACQYGQEGAVRLLLKMESDVDAESQNGCTSLHLAAQTGNQNVVEILLKEGASVQKLDRNHCTALHYACKGGNKAVLQLLLKQKIDVNAADKTKRTALHLAAEIGNEEIVKLLLHKGAEIEARDELDRSPLYEAAEKGHEKVVATLLDHKADIDAQGKGGWMALGRAVVKGHEAVVRVLLSRGANIKGKIGDWSALHWTAQKGNELLTRLLLDHGADVRARDGWGKTPLHRVVRSNSSCVALLLLDKGVDIEAVDIDGCTALGCAAEDGDATIVQLLLEKGANVSAMNHNGKRPLHQAAARGHHKVVQLLLGNGADIRAKDNDAKLALHQAAMGGHCAVVELLLKEGAEDMVEKFGKLALHVAAEKGHEKVVGQLLQSSLCLERGDIHIQDWSEGMTPCHWAAKEGHMEVVKLLLENEADPYIQDRSGRTVWDWMDLDTEELKVLLAVAIN